MTLTRWKLLAGVFGIAMVGVVAMANPQCPGKQDPARETAPPTREVAFKPADTPKTFSVAIPATVKAAERLPDLVPIASAPVSPPKVEFAPTIPALPSTPRMELPAELPTPIAFAPVQLPSVTPTPLPTPLPTQDRVIELPLPGFAATKPGLPTAELKLELPRVDPQPIPSSPPLVKFEPTLPASQPPATPIVAVPTGGLSPFDAPAPSRAPVAVTEAPAVKEEVETRVRVVVPLGKSPAKFDVLAGDSVLLQAVCEQVEVRSPSEKGGAASPIKASGKVRFTAPGCEGTCDSLAVLPGTGEVELTGSVRVLCKHGKAETEIQAATMKFKLGSAPSPVPLAIPSTFIPNASR